MKKLLLFIFILSSVIANGQVWLPRNNNYGQSDNRASHDSVLFFPTGCGTPVDTNWLNSHSQSGAGVLKKWAIYGDSCAGLVYFWNPKTMLWAVVGSGSGGGGGNPFADNTALVKNSADTTKLLIISADSVPTGTTVIWYFKGLGGTVAMNSAGQQFQGIDTFTANPLVPLPAQHDSTENAAPTKYVDQAIGALKTLTYAILPRLAPVDTLARVAQPLTFYGNTLVSQTADSTHVGFMAAAIYAYIAAIRAGLIKDTVIFYPIGAGIQAVRSNAVGDTTWFAGFNPSSTIGVSKNSDSSVSWTSLLQGVNSVNINGASVQLSADSNAVTPYLLYGPSIASRKQWNSFYTYPLWTAHNRGLGDSTDYNILHFSQTVLNLGTTGDDSLASASIRFDSLYLIRKKFVQGNGILIGRTGTVFGEDVYNFGFDTTYAAFQTYVSNHAGGGGTTYTADETTLHLSSSQFSIKSTYPGQASIITLGTVTTGVWNGTALGAAYGGAPSAGTTGQVLTKNSNTSYDYSWITPSGGGGGTPSGPDRGLQYDSLGSFSATGYLEWNRIKLGLAISSPSVGTTEVDSAGFILYNPTAAATGAQQNSAPLELWGSGFAGTPAVSQHIGARLYVAPAQGTTNASALLQFQTYTAGAWANVASLSSLGLFLANGTLQSTNSVIAGTNFQATTSSPAQLWGGDSAYAFSIRNLTNPGALRIYSTYTAGNNCSYLELGAQKAPGVYTFGSYGYGPTGSVLTMNFATKTTVPTVAAHDSTANAATTLYVDRAVVQGSSSGVYTPTIASATNGSVAGGASGSYIKVGNMVYVQLYFQYNITLTATTTGMTFSLPITSSLSSGYAGPVSTVPPNVGGSSGSATLTSTTQGTISFYATALSGSFCNVYVSFMYSL